MECKCKLTPLSVLFIWCNGEPWSVGEIDEYMQEAIADENYELAGDCKREIERRQALE